LALLAPTPANADVESRVKKLEEELSTIKETSKQILKKLESSVFEGIPEKLQSAGRQIYDAVLHHGSQSAAHVQKEYPKWLSFAHEYTKDLPTHATKTANLVHKEGTKHWNHSLKLLSSFLAKQGVPQQYIQYASLAILALVAVVAALITLSILSAILTALCCAGKSREQQNREIRKKSDKRAAQQHKEHERKTSQ